MQDDVYLIAADGWMEAAKPRGIVEDKERKIKETPDLVIKRKKFKMDLIPPALIVERWFAKEHADIETLQAKQETTARELEEFVEEHSGEEGLLAAAVNEKGNVTKGGVKDQLRAVQDDPESMEERTALTRCLALLEAESEASEAVSKAQLSLDEKVLAWYGKLNESEIKTLVVEDKWFTSIGAEMAREVERLTQQLAARVKDLEQRYSQPLPALERALEALSAKVEKHLIMMGHAPL
jgi:type I restriction enzyme M protein